MCTRRNHDTEEHWKAWRVVALNFEVCDECFLRSGPGARTVSSDAIPPRKIKYIKVKRSAVASASELQMFSNAHSSCSGCDSWNTRGSSGVALARAIRRACRRFGGYGRGVVRSAQENALDRNGKSCFVCVCVFFYIFGPGRILRVREASLGF